MITLLQTESPDLEAIGDAIDTSLLTWSDAATAGVILISAVIFARIIRVTIKRFIARTRTDDFLGDLIGRLLGYLIVAFGLVYALESLGIAITPILGALGIVGIALAFALQDILENFVAGIILQMRRPFTSGDEIVSGSHEGSILEIDARAVTLRTPDGETVILPSAEVIKNPIVNHSVLGRRRTTIAIGVAYGTNVEQAAQIAVQATRDVDGVLTTPEPEALIHNFGDSSVDIALRFWHQPSIAARWSTRDQVARSIATAFEDNNIEIPFPQRVIHQPT
jgi:small-conductance mechanosensitive channel